MYVCMYFSLLSIMLSEWYVVLLWMIMFYWVVSSQWTTFCYILLLYFFICRRWENVVNMHIIGAIISFIWVFSSHQNSRPRYGLNWTHINWHTEIYTRKLLPINKFILGKWEEIQWPSQMSWPFLIVRRKMSQFFGSCWAVRSSNLVWRHNTCSIYENLICASKCSFQQSCSNIQRKMIQTF